MKFSKTLIDAITLLANRYNKQQNIGIYGQISIIYSNMRIQKGTK